MYFKYITLQSGLPFTPKWLLLHHPVKMSKTSKFLGMIAINSEQRTEF